MSEFNFKSQPATSIEQSERLLALGLKKETADMVYMKIGNEYILYVIQSNEQNIMWKKDVPAWSLHQLIKLAYGNWEEEIVPIYLGNSYDMLIGRIEFQIKQGKFNKEYLA